MSLPTDSSFLQRENVKFFQNLLVVWEQAENGMSLFFCFL
jgi:hypothetical protein